MTQADKALPNLMRLVNGYQVSQAIHVAAVLGIPDLLKDVAKHVDDLAAQTGTDGGGLYRLLGALAAIGIFSETDDKMFGLAPMGQHLRSDASQSAAGWARNIGQEYFWQTWGNLLTGVRTGKNVFRELHGEDVWSYREKHLEAGAIFDQAMTSLSLLTSRQVVAAYDFSACSTIIDVGGGRGGLLAAILSTNLGVRGILFDQPHVVSDELLSSAGVIDRCEIACGSFFESIPQGGAAYILKAIIHDWKDAESIAILKRCREAMDADGKLLLVERVLAPPNEGPAAKFSDLNMLVMAGGRERTETEFANLLHLGGFSLPRVISTGPDQFCIIEASPA
ncbi:MAG TPA: methyltransferase [Dehalococcoidia bacterium]|nr:methyltransferase [Dehalococcoidia bacterium]